jgi:hypothetical protein
VTRRRETNELSQLRGQLLGGGDRRLPDDADGAAAGRAAAAPARSTPRDMRAPLWTDGMRPSRVALVLPRTPCV